MELQLRSAEGMHVHILSVIDVTSTTQETAQSATYANGLVILVEIAQTRMEIKSEGVHVMSVGVRITSRICVLG